MRSNRAAHRVNQTRIGEACGKSQVWASLVERGLLTPSTEDAGKISQLLGAPKEALFPEIAELQKSRGLKEKARL